jgi:hypothetical protein
MKRGHVRLVALIERGVDEGCFVTDGPSSVAWYLLTTLDGLIVHTSIGVNQGLVDVTRAVTASTEQDLGLAPGSLAVADLAP